MKFFKHFFRNRLPIGLLLIVALMSMNLYSQNQAKQKKIFVRVFDFGGKKIAKGHVNFTTDSILELRRNDRLITIQVEDIKHIITKRSAGHSVLVGSLIGGVLGSIIGAASSNEETKTANGGWLFGEYEYTTGTSPGTGAAIGGHIGIAGGALTGLGFSVFKKSKTYLVEGDIEKWKILKENLK